MLFSIKWLICQRSAAYTSASKSCALYLAKKFSIVKACKSSLLNRRSELVSLRTSQETSSSHAKVPDVEQLNFPDFVCVCSCFVIFSVSLYFRLCLFTGFFVLFCLFFCSSTLPPPPLAHTHAPPSPHAPHSQDTLYTRRVGNPLQTPPYMRASLLQTSRLVSFSASGITVKSLFSAPVLIYFNPCRTTGAKRRTAVKRGRRLNFERQTVFSRL